jgi:transposase
MGRPSKYSPEFREQAVELVRATGKSVAQVARDLSINDATLGNWVKADNAERGVPDSSGLLPLTAAERAELTKLRRENLKLRVEREILKSGGLLRHGVDEVTRFAFIDQEKALYDVGLASSVGSFA